jgi:hypothetical protein
MQTDLFSTDEITTSSPAFVKQVLAAVPCTYVLTVSEYFPKGHIKEGQETKFVNLIARLDKIHTIRGNYELWAKRAEKINRGEAVLSVRCWTGKPYNSKQREVLVFEKIGVEKLEFDKLLGWFINDIDSDFTLKDFAKNDGLSVEDFKSWFKGQDFTKPKAIIHFSEFRYCR